MKKKHNVDELALLACLRFWIFIYKDCINTHTFACGETGRLGEKAQDHSGYSRGRETGDRWKYIHICLWTTRPSQGMRGGQGPVTVGWPQRATEGAGGQVRGDQTYMGGGECLKFLAHITNSKIYEDMKNHIEITNHQAFSCKIVSITIIIITNSINNINQQ